MREASFDDEEYVTTLLFPVTTSSSPAMEK